MASKKKDWRSDPDGMPETMYVRQDTYAEDKEEFLVSPRPGPMVEDEGPTLVGTYKLVKVQRLRKRVVPVKD